MEASNLVRKGGLNQHCSPRGELRRHFNLSGGLILAFHSSGGLKSAFDFSGGFKSAFDFTGMPLTLIAGTRGVSKKKKVDVHNIEMAPLPCIPP